MGLREHRGEVEAYVQSDIELVRDLPDLTRVGPVYDELSKHHRILAGCALLLDGDVDTFTDLLTQSGHARAHLLRRRSEQPALRNPYFAASNADALFDVLSARNLTLAQDVAALSPTAWWPGEEYEEDFHYAHFLHLYVQNRSFHAVALAQTLADLERSTGDDEAARPRLCKALLEARQDAFDEAFNRLLDERDLELQEDRDQFWPDGKIGLRIKEQLHVEALGLLNLADSAGLRTAPEYRYCPALARMPATRAPVASVF